MADIKPTSDAIDEAIEGYVTRQGGGDAMVWSAEPPRTVAPIMRRSWTDEEIALARERAIADFRRFAEGMRQFAVAIRPAFEAVGEALHRFCGLVQPIAEARAEHRKQLHRAYRHRCLARRRRNR